MHEHDDLASYYKAAESWAEDRQRGTDRNLHTAWIVAGCAGVVALAEGIALMVMMPLKQVEPIAVLVDRQTGNVQRLDLGKEQAIKLDQALLSSMLAQYVIAREGFNIGALKADYNKVALWSSGDARSNYIASMQASNPASPLSAYPRSAVISVEIRSISPLSTDTTLVRFSTMRSDGGNVPVPQGTWAAVIRYRFSNAGMSAENRLINPLGFQVLRYQRNAEFLPTAAPVPAGQPATSAQIGPVRPTGTIAPSDAPSPVMSGHRAP